MWWLYFDYCYEVVFDFVICVNLGGLKYEECVYFGLVMLYWYLNKCDGIKFEEIFKLVYFD